MDTTLVLAFMAASQTFNLPPGLLQAVCKVESNHTVAAINHNDKGSPSLGVCQVKLATAKFLGYAHTEDTLLSDPKVNAYYAAKYIRRQLDRYQGDTTKAVAAYNAGSCRYNAEGLIKNRQYVTKVLAAWETQ